MKTEDDLHDSERVFHDRWASHEFHSSIDINAAFEAITAPENRFILKLIGNIKGKKILDIGTGLGESAIYFAKQGARVTAVDISPNMIELCRKNAELAGVELETHVALGESIGLPGNSFDIVYAANLLHHIQDRSLFFSNVHDVLKPGGLFVSWDPVKYNPLLNVYRHKATAVRTPDESPLGITDIRTAKKVFPGIRYRTFWLTTMFLFIKYYFLDKKDLNKERYWKVILGETPESIGWWFLPLQKLDAVLLALPGIKLLAWNMVLWGTKSR